VFFHLEPVFLGKTALKIVEKLFFIRAWLVHPKLP
jgi:hypothetical protein